MDTGNHWKCGRATYSRRLPGN